MDPKENKKSNKGLVAVIAALLIVACAGGGWYAHSSKIKAMQNAGVEQLAAAVNLDDYREAEQTEIKAILDSTEAAIRESKDQAEIDSMVEKAVADTAGFKTAAAYAMEEEGIAKLKDSVKLDDYREAEQKEIKKILKNAEEKITEAADQAEIDALVEKAVAKIGELKTDAQYAEEEAAAAAAAAKKSSKKKKSKGSGGCIGGGDVWN